MASFARVAVEVNESTSSAFLVAFQQHAASQGYFQPLAEHVEVKLKEVRCSRLQKDAHLGRVNPARLSPYQGHQSPLGT